MKMFWREQSSINLTNIIKCLLDASIALSVVHIKNKPDKAPVLSSQSVERTDNVQKRVYNRIPRGG